MGSRSRWIGALTGAALLTWFTMNAADSAEEVRRVKPPSQKHHRPRTTRPATGSTPDTPTETVQITVTLTRSPHLRQQFDTPSTFDPEPLFPIDVDKLLPANDVVDAFQDVLASEKEEERAEAIDDFLDTVFDEDGSVLDTSTPWAALIEIEAERLAVEAEYKAAQAHELAVIQRASTGDAADLAALSELPIVAKDHAALIELAMGLAEAHPDSETSSIAFLFAAQAHADWDSNVYSEPKAQSVVLDALYSTDDPTVIDAAIGILTPLSASGLQDDDIAIIEQSYTVVDPSLRAPLARFLLDQQYTAGEPTKAVAWADKLETELLMGHPWGSDTGDRWWELDEARDRLAADMNEPATHWRAGFDRIARQCWNAMPQQVRARSKPNTTIHWTWDDEWIAQSIGDHDLTRCIEQRGPQVPAPNRLLNVSLTLRMEGSAG